MRERVELIKSTEKENERKRDTKKWFKTWMQMSQSDFIRALFPNVFCGHLQVRIKPPKKIERKKKIETQKK